MSSKKSLPQIPTSPLSSPPSSPPPQSPQPPQLPQIQFQQYLLHDLNDNETIATATSSSTNPSSDGGGYTPSDFYNGQSGTSERRDSPRNTIWNSPKRHSQHQQQQQQQQPHLSPNLSPRLSRKQSYQQYQPIQNVSSADQIIKSDIKNKENIDSYNVTESFAEEGNLEGTDSQIHPDLRHSKSYRPRPNENELIEQNQILQGRVHNNDNDNFTKILSGGIPIETNFTAANVTTNKPPTRTKSLVRPERSRNPLYRRNTGHRSINRPGDDPLDERLGNEESQKFLSIFPADERRKFTHLQNDKKEPKVERKWYQCQFPTIWVMFSRCITCWAPSSLLSCFGIKDRSVQQAWREKIALVFIILVLCAIVGFLTFGLNQAFCRVPPVRVRFGGVNKNQSVILGKVYDISKATHKITISINSTNLADPSNNAGGRDLTFLFQTTNLNCQKWFKPKNQSNTSRYFPCTPIDLLFPGSPNPQANALGIGCHSNLTLTKALKDSKVKQIGDLYFTWDDINSLTKKRRNYTVYNGNVLDMDRLKWIIDTVELDQKLKTFANDKKYIGRDNTYYLQKNKEMASCLVNTIRVGVIDFSSIGCVITNVITYISLIVIVAVVLVRFLLAVLFGWVMSWRLGNFREETAKDRAKREQEIEKWENVNNHFLNDPRLNSSSTSFNVSKSRYSTPLHGSSTPLYRRQDNRSTGRQYNSGLPESGEKKFHNGSASSLIHLSSTNSSSAAITNELSTDSRPPSISNDNNQSRANSLSSTSSSAIQGTPYQNNIPEQRFNFALMHTIMLVTCYSEGRQGLKTTLDSLVSTDYPSSHKIIMCIADGIIKGAGNDLSTPEMCLSLMSNFIVPKEEVQAHSYVAIADGKKRHNKAKVYAGYYRYHESDDPIKVVRRIPMITLVKCGGPGDDETRAGNRGKRDSQIILMSFLQKVMFDERMTPLEYEFFNAIRTVSGVTPDCFELVLMVDADTKIFPDSLTRMVACMSRDPAVMGLCGETKIANKSDTWVTMIQVFEYYISHHMQKAFESIFGGVTCLPGCFCMYRIKAPKGAPGFWVPILANPDVVEKYSENIVDTLHKKNLLLLGEDRYLTTLMLQTFTKRKMMFVPQAVCKTIVPDTFLVLRSQRRRWINSTVHNLLELVLIPDLCGTFCFSMQFVIFMELVGTVVLPAAISFTFYLIIVSFFQRPVPWVPLSLLAVVLGLPAILILLTTRKLIYVGWMLIYLLSLPIWNFVLPVYAYWHFDDFSWGQTRVVQGDKAEKDHSRKEGEFDSSQIIMKRWAEWEREKRAHYRSSQQKQQLHSSIISPEEIYAPSANQLSASTIIQGSEKPLNYSPQLHNSRGKRRTANDSLMLPPPLSSTQINTNNDYSNENVSILQTTQYGPISPPSTINISSRTYTNNNYPPNNNNNNNNNIYNINNNIVNQNDLPRRDS
ncbi:hypothetical protein Glove_495g30 [Diversispora epigaea]|uniref:chitin synthase n=1 Tax=Diversispora epigaea TaxID=1348612 RepID=A0A397GK47_9GLOM|nr:hypothetical protein Glove_495g30 [Diversispora epigaea]